MKFLNEFMAAAGAGAVDGARAGFRMGVRLLFAMLLVAIARMLIGVDDAPPDLLTVRIIDMTAAQFGGLVITCTIFIAVVVVIVSDRRAP